MKPDFNEEHKTDIRICGPKRNFSKYPSATVKEILDYFKDKPQLEVDTETEGFDPHTKKIITLQLGDQHRQYVIDVRSVDILLFKDLIENKLCLLQNAKFDYKMLYMAGIILDKIYDTLLGEMIIFNGYDQERGVGLDSIIKNYLGITLEKETRNTFGSLNGEPLKDRQIQYAGRDVAYLSKVKELQKRYIDKYDLNSAVAIAMEVVKSLGDMEINGMYLDKKEWLELAQQKNKELIALEFKMDSYLIEDSDAKFQPVTIGHDLFGETTRTLNINYGSPQQMKRLLRKLGMQVPDTAEETLVKLKDDPFVEMLLEHRGLSKKVSTYGEKFLKYINEATGRVHTEFWQIKSTYRLGSGNKKSNAPNIQNIPSSNEYRNCFKPREGYTWVSIDYSSQELRIIADKSNERKFIDAINRGEDLHCFAYNTMTGENITKKDKEKRTTAKAINFGKPFGMSPYKYASEQGVSVEEAEKVFSLYEKAFPDLNAQLERQANFGKKNGYVLIDKRHKGRRWFPEFKEIANNPTMSWKERNRLNGIIQRASYNTPIQGTAAIQTKQAMIDVRNWLRESGHWQNDIFMICQIHDELNFEIKDELVEEVVPTLEKLMINAANIYLELLDMEVDSTITKQWTKE